MAIQTIHCEKKTKFTFIFDFKQSNDQSLSRRAGGRAGDGKALFTRYGGNHKKQNITSTLG